MQADCGARGGSGTAGGADFGLVEKYLVLELEVARKELMAKRALHREREEQHEAEVAALALGSIRAYWAREVWCTVWRWRSRTS